MDKLSSHELVGLLLALATLLAAARAMGEVARKLGQPAILGELLAGILLGPTVLGALAPELQASLFPKQGATALALDGFKTISIALFLLVAGMEVDLSTVWRQGKPALLVGATGVWVPFAAGWLATALAPGLMGLHASADPRAYQLFLATAFSISALPVIAKTLLDLRLYRSEFGMVVIASAVLNDLVGWIIFAVILGDVAGAEHGGRSAGATIGWVLGFALVVLTLGRWLVHRALPWIQAHSVFPAGVFAFALSLGFLGAAFTEWVGVHAVFGTFLVGVALGDSQHLRERTRATMHEFISAIFGPIFFASIGLNIDFVANFDLGLTLYVCLVATLGKLLGCGLGALLAGIARREAWAVAWSMNARGAMEIIVGLVALQAGLIDARMFVALFVMAIATTLGSAFALQRIFGKRRTRRASYFLSSRAFTPTLGARTRKDATEELARLLASAEGLPFEAVRDAVWERERSAPTGIGSGIAIPHARLNFLRVPCVALGISERGVDFDAPDGQAAQLIFLILSPAKDDLAQLEIIADISRTLQRSDTRKRLLAATNVTEALAVMRIEATAEVTA